MNRFGEKLKAIRTEKGISTKELAEKAGMSEVQIKNLEQGKNIPSALTILKLSTALKFNYDILYEYSVNK